MLHFKKCNRFVRLISQSLQVRLFSNVKIKKGTINKTNKCHPAKTSSTFDASKIRNVGIIAHIDAGKTTTTERMLYYSGANSTIGNVNDGNTVTDFLEQERERGITIMSAVVHFMWKGHRINLVDTPGHIDFTCEVESSLRVLDGAVLVLDASAGVEAQTLSTWKQALKYRIPQIAFINKMDKAGASFSKSIKSISDKLGRMPLPIQLPIISASDNSFNGVVDLIHMKKLIWNIDGDGKFYENIKLDSKLDGDLFDMASSERDQMLETLVNVDEELGEIYIRDSHLTNLTPDHLNQAIRRATLNCQVLPVLCGSSLRNKAVQPLLDSILTYLPDPIEHNLIGDLQDDGVNNVDGTMALAFKIMHNKRREPITFLRIYSGHLSSGLSLFNATKNCKEKIDKMFQINADEYEYIGNESRGNIVAVTGFKETTTGDVLCSAQLPSSSSSLFDVLTIQVPDPVYFCSVEPPSLSVQKDFDTALECLAREDPSLKVNVDSSTGQTVLGGMGQLHLEIVKSRIFTEYGIDADLGPLQIAYKETLTSTKKVKTVFEKTIGESRYRVEMMATFHPVHESEESDSATKSNKKKSLFSILPNPDSALAKYGLRPNYVKAIEDGLMSGFSKGPLLGYPLSNIRMELNEFVTSSRATMAIISSSVTHCVREALKKDDVQLLQPIMNVQVFTTPDHLGTVLSDLAQRESHILSVNKEDDSCHNASTVLARTPLSRLEDFSSALRTKTSGMASFNMNLSSYDVVSDKLLTTLLNN
ncbi:hypothetical protein HELRODRAFT_110936 [Helobdella robusta]|uniref:Elongation factor G2 n=1 Tax=Helobdella robusta TaxID=6412 RepID=T1EF64_HELRO|nr:hypothetical protein HELRODRAFT_110936 [Helobdella robusta]ESO06901.1 hypothetical protein HELRODRAFT_110936 [Helobdella robusta]